jgi:hypothetical protein
LNDAIKTEGIVDCGCQVILMRKDVWTSLRIPLLSQKILTMESANGTRNNTSGLIPRIKFTLGSVILWCPVQVVETAPFEMLLGRPFMAVSQAITKDFYNGNMEITLTDPESGEVVTVPTHVRETPTRTKENGDPAKPPAPFISGFQ